MPRWRSACVLLLSILLAPSSAAAVTTTLSLDGTWDFRLDPKDEGAKAGWAGVKVSFGDRIQVPGAWDAQGFGGETDKLRHNHVGKAWYRRTVEIPREWAGRRAFLCVGGVHRYADVWVDGRHLGEHIGYLSPFEFELKDAAPGRPVTIAIRVDSEQRWDVDALTGCFDIIDEMFTNWGGIWGHVWLEARGPAWLEDLYVHAEPNGSQIFGPGGTDTSVCVGAASENARTKTDLCVPPSADAQVHISARMVGDSAVGKSARLEILDANGRMMITREIKIEPATSAPSAGRELRADVPFKGARLWTPDTPYLYTARLTLSTDDAISTCESRFGIRRIDTRGHEFLLNGRRLFLRGYGDDSVFPQTMAAPSDKDFYVKRLKIAKDYGFNFVRHHSTMLPPEYYDAADEVGMLVSAEFPIAYTEYYNRAKGPAIELYKTEWAAAIRRLRNHPSIFDWSMGNEQWLGIPLGPELYRIAKGLDPLRLVIDSDGLFPNVAFNKADRPTLDFFSTQFNCHNLPLDQPDKYNTADPRKPVICHETGNFTTFPRIASLIPEFRDNFKPFWLTPTAEKLSKLGLTAEADLWAENSERLYLLCHKLNTEAIRINPQMSGYTWWLLQDYWTGSNGICDTYFRPKPAIRPELVRQFNAPVVLLQRGLDLAYRSGDQLAFDLLVRNDSLNDLEQCRFECTVSAKAAPVLDRKGDFQTVAQGQLTPLQRCELQLPKTSRPECLKISARLTWSGGESRNEWTTWVYPAEAREPRALVKGDTRLYASRDLLDSLRGFSPTAIPAKGDLPARGLYVVTQPSPRVLDAVARGACAIALNPHGLFPSVPNRFKTAWWLGSPGDCNTGTLVHAGSPARDIAPAGWCDAGWYRLLEGAQAYVLNDLPQRPEVLVRGIDVHTVCRDKALLLQARVGKGTLIVSGLRLLNDTSPSTAQSGASTPPEREWLLGRLLEYAAAGQRPKAELPLDWLRARVAESPGFDGPELSGFARLVRATEQQQYATWRGIDATVYVCRQTSRDNTVEWVSVPAPEALDEPTVAFVFGGGLGWLSQPDAGGFTLLVDGRETLAFDLTREHKTWRSADGKVVLTFEPRRHLPEDALGLFHLTLDHTLVKPGQPVRLSVQSRGQGSRRWFGITP